MLTSSPVLPASLCDSAARAIPTLRAHISEVASCLCSWNHQNGGRRAHVCPGLPLMSNSAVWPSGLIIALGARGSGPIPRTTLPLLSLACAKALPCVFSCDVYDFASGAGSELSGDLRGAATCSDDCAHRTKHMAMPARLIHLRNKEKCSGAWYRSTDLWAMSPTR